MAPRIRSSIRSAIVTLALASAILPSTVLAQRPEFDPTCWTRDQCEQYSTIEAHYEPDSTGCKAAGWGRCYRGVRIPIAVSILGKRDVGDLREYIVLAFQYAIGLAAIAAVVVIMAAGLRWMTSGVSDAKKEAMTWIRNAVLGLVLILSSYVLLKTVNPDLVRLALPRFALLRPIALGGTFCDAVDADVPILTTGGQPVVRRPENFKCNFEYATPTASIRQCRGTYCDPGKTCAPKSADTYECVSGTISGEVVGDGEAFLDNGMELVVVCANGETRTIMTTNGQMITERRKYRYVFPASSSAMGSVESACGGSYTSGTLTSKVRGFFMKVEVNDDSARYTGVDDWYAVGGKGCGGSSKPIVGSSQAASGITDPGSMLWMSVPSSELIPASSIFPAIRPSNPGSFTCNVTLNRTDFPDR